MRRRLVYKQINASNSLGMAQRLSASAVSDWFLIRTAVRVPQTSCGLMRRRDSSLW